MKYKDLKESFKGPTLDTSFQKLIKIVSDDEYGVEVAVINNRMEIVGVLEIDEYSYDCFVTTHKEPIHQAETKFPAQGMYIKKDEILKITFTTNGAPTFYIKDF